MRRLSLLLLAAAILPALLFAAACGGSTRSPATEATAAAVIPDPPDVGSMTAADAVAFFGGRLDAVPGGSPADLNDASPADILETFDNILLDRAAASGGDEAVARIYAIIARSALDSLTALYPAGYVLLALDAGHGGEPGFEGGADGDEWQHTRQAAAVLEQLAASDPAYARVIVRRVFNDGVPSDFRLPADRTRDITSNLLLRQSRVSALAVWARGWNEEHPGTPLALHEVSVHFNLNSDVAMVLHQGSTVSPEHRSLSVTFGRDYLARAVPALDATGLLGSPLRLFDGSGLHDDVMMWTPLYAADDTEEENPSRYVALQGSTFFRGYLDRILESWPQG